MIAHDRRRILHCNVTGSPEAVWVALQLRQTWEEGEEPQRFLLFDRDSKFGGDVASTLEAVGCQPLRTAFRSPWQNGVAERIYERSQLLVEQFSASGLESTRHDRPVVTGAGPHNY